MRFSIIFSTLALAAPLASVESDYAKLLSIVGSSRPRLARRDINTTIVMFNSDVSISEKLAHVETLLRDGSHIEKLYDVSDTATGAGVVGYVGTFSDEALTLIQDSEATRSVQEDVMVYGLGHEVAQPELLKRQDDFYVTLSNQPWWLARISHKQNPKGTSKGSQYTYRTTSLYPTHIYIVDSGIRTSHEVFKGRAKWGANFVNDIDRDENGHGTSVGSIATQVSVTSTIWAVKVLGANNSGALSWILSGLEWVINHAATQNGDAVINMSLSTGVNNAFDSLVEQALLRNITLTAAAGNSDNDACSLSPAESSRRYKGFFTAASSNENDQQSGFSGYGSCVDLLAPGESVVAANAGSDNGYSSWTGTSMSAPIVAGMAAYWLTVSHYNLEFLETILELNRDVITNIKQDTPNILAWNLLQ